MASCDAFYNPIIATLLQARNACYSSATANYLFCEWQANTSHSWCIFAAETWWDIDDCNEAWAEAMRRCRENERWEEQTCAQFNQELQYQQAARLACRWSCGNKKAPAQPGGRTPAAGQALLSWHSGGAVLPYAEWRMGCGTEDGQ